MDRKLIALLGVGLFVVGLVVAIAGMAMRNRPQASSTQQLASASATATSTPSPEPTTTVNSVPILMYHYIRPLPDQKKDPVGYNLSVAPETFQKQLDQIKAAGYTTTTLDAFTEHRLPEKPIILTFDDGYDDAYSAAFPALKERGMVATFYVITDYMDHPRYMSWEQLKQMAAAGMQIESHTTNHADLSKISRDEQLKELVDSKRAIEEHLGTKVRHFCYPSGKFTEETLALTKAAGYETAVTVNPGIANVDGDLLQLPRVRIYPTTDVLKLVTSDR